MSSKRRAAAIRAVFFDVGNTLLYPYPSVSEVVRQVLAEAGHERELDTIDRFMPLVDAYYEDRYRADDTFWTDEEETSSVWVGMYSVLCRELGIHEDATALARRVYDEFGSGERWRAYPDVAPALERLADAGVRLGIISNWDARLPGLLRHLGLERFLDTVVSSAEVGLHKPDPRIFELAARNVGVRAAEAAHIGDHHYADILGAQAAGMRPVLIDRHGAAVNVGPRPIANLDDIETVLGL